MIWAVQVRYDGKEYLVPYTPELHDKDLTKAVCKKNKYFDMYGELREKYKSLPILEDEKPV